MTDVSKPHVPYPPSLTMLSSQVPTMFPLSKIHLTLLENEFGDFPLAFVLDMLVILRISRILQEQIDHPG